VETAQSLVKYDTIKKSMKLNTILSISRPRFWMYELGTFFIGVVVASTSVQNLIEWKVLVFAFFFLIPANILIYGINDIFDYETDILNSKKAEYENLLTPDKHASVWRWILITNLPFVLFVFFLSTSAILALLAFFFFASFYSAKPIRAKTKPFFDSIFSASHYIFTGVFGYFLAGGTSFPIWGFIAGMLWAIAMHAYSAVPDITADTNAGFQTIATWLGKQKTIIFCLGLYITSGIIFYQLTGFFIFILIGIITYTILMIWSLCAKTDAKLFTIYTYFPWINFILPMTWSIVYMITKFG